MYAEPFCCCPGCGECSAHRNEPKRKKELTALRARVAELEEMNKMLCGKLDDQRRALWDPCAPYLKDGETPAQCIVRNRRDVDIALSSLARDRARVAELEAALGQCRRTHYECDDSWYSCPKSADGCSNEFEEHDKCNCGADHTNAIIDAALRLPSNKDSQRKEGA